MIGCATRVDFLVERDGFEPEISLSVLPSRQSETSVPPNRDLDGGDARNASPIHGAPKRRLAGAQARRAVRAITGTLGLCDKLEG